MMFFRATLVWCARRRIRGLPYAGHLPGLLKL